MKMIGGKQVTGWRKITSDRDAWKCILKKASHARTLQPMDKTKGPNCVGSYPPSYPKKDIEAHSETLR